MPGTASKISIGPDGSVVKIDKGVLSKFKEDEDKWIDIGGKGEFSSVSVGRNGRVFARKDGLIYWPEEACVPEPFVAKNFQSKPTCASKPVNNVDYTVKGQGQRTPNNALNGNWVVYKTPHPDKKEITGPAAPKSCTHDKNGKVFPVGT
jgi:hypothetical protein